MKELPGANADGVCYIFGACDLGEMVFSPGPDDCVIAADGGYRHVVRLGLSADLVIGDFDSLGRPPEGETVETFPKDKDDTDMMLAVKAGLRMGYSRFALYGGVGGRLDHTLANIQALAYLSKRGAEGVLVGGGMAVTALTDGELRFDKDKRGIVSIFCLGESAFGVTLEGLRYPLDEATLTNDMPLGVSNAFTGEKSRVAVRKGTLAVLWYESPFVVWPERNLFARG
ncbi:MAG: thiamine diphosphokinase [Bacillota bacterium]